MFSYWRRTRPNNANNPASSRPSFAGARQESDSASETASVREETSTVAESAPAAPIQRTEVGGGRDPDNRDHQPSFPRSMPAHRSDIGGDSDSPDKRLAQDRLIDRNLMTYIAAQQQADANSDVDTLDQESPIPVPTPTETTLHSHKRFKCDVCSKEESPELCCFTCDPKGLPYHKECWDSERLHRPRPDRSYQIHRSIPIASLPRLHYLNEPNRQTFIEKSRLQEDDQNCFVELDNRSKQFRFGHRAFSLLRNGRNKDSIQYPSFVSFIGLTMNGKSFLIRALQHSQGLPSPIPAPGAKDHNHTSTSSDIHLYPDSTSASDESPILFLDCEGFGGSEVPVSLLARLTPAATAERRARVEAAYPRLVYAFSTCIVFVTSGPLAEADNIKRRLIDYASQGASGSQNQGFKPSLFVIFNRFGDGNRPDFDWSIDSSSEAFLADENRAELGNFYSNIRVIYIPSMDKAEAAIALQQLDAFEQVLRQEHRRAFLRRREFRLDLTSAQLTLYLGRALSHFSKDSNVPFDWASEALPLGFSSDASAAMVVDLWTQYVRHHATSRSYQRYYDRAREDFEKHIIFCLRLGLSRHPPRGLQCTRVPLSWTEKIEQLSVDCAPCSADSSAGLKCEKVQLRHGDHHQAFNPQRSRAIRWSGDYEPYTNSQTFVESFRAALQSSAGTKVSLDELRTFPEDIRSVVSCLGCLQGPPSTVLACGHAFCFDCIRELTHDEPLPHQCTVIQCPIHQAPQAFSPRLLPIQSGYRILSLDGGGVKGLGQLVMMRHIEKKCFEIPLMHLFDLVVGTSIGGQIALALNSGKQSRPLTVSAATEKFRKLMASAFERDSWYIPIIGAILDRTKYKTTTLETCLQDLLGKETKLFSAATSSQSGLPNIAVTTVVLQPFQAHLITNYNRKPLSDALPLLFGPTANDCMSVWAAARSTSAAVPYFKPLEWQGQILLDGGFKLNCPAACAYSEAKSIWPDKHCDILLSLGTGSATNNQPPPVRNGLFGVVRAVAVDLVNAEDAWTRFKAALKQKDGIFRLNPTYNGNGFALDESHKLDEIAREVEDWIATRSSSLTHICNQLIAALFFFRLKTTEDGVQVGEIVCRLPSGLEARRNLIRCMLDENSKLFVVECDGHSDDTRLFVDAPQTLRHLRVIDEMHLRVPPLNLPATGGMKIHVRMRSLGPHQPGDMPQWSPISGSPYLMQGE